jgi:hypothetical protein
MSTCARRFLDVQVTRVHLLVTDEPLHGLTEHAEELVGG